MFFRRNRKKEKKRANSPVDSFALDTPIYYFNQRHPYTIRQACEGVQIFGGIGSGKTSGSGAALAKSYLRSKFGGLVLCAKKDELDTWLRYARETGREKDIIVFDASGRWRFPFLQYEVEREGEGAGYTENLVRLFTTIQEAIERGKGGNGGDPYWQRATQQLMRNAIDLSLIIRGEVSLPLLYDIITSAPKDKEESEDAKWQSTSACFKLIQEGLSRENLDEWTKHDLISTVTYWLEEFMNLDNKPRSSIISTFTGMADNLMRRPFRMLFTEPAPREKIALPELTHHGNIIIMNLPVKEFGEAGRAAQVAYKYMWQQAAERRNIAKNSRPVFLWADEAQNFATDYDMQFQATARSSRACTVYLTQNMPNYYAEMGGKDSKHRVDSLVGNLQTKIWHANSDPVTNSQAAEIIGRNWQQRRGSSTSAGSQNFSFGESVNEQFNFDFIPQRFTRLRKGSPINNFIVDGIVYQSGRTWDGGKTYLEAEFDQRYT